MMRRTLASRRASWGAPAKMISPRSITYKRQVSAGTWWMLDSAMRMATPSRAISTMEAVMRGMIAGDRGQIRPSILSGLSKTRTRLPDAT